MGQASVKISDALGGIQRLYTETAPLIYYVEEIPTHVAKMDAIIGAIEDSPIEAVSSVITLTEVLTHPLKLGNARLVQAYRDILLNSRRFRLLPITSRIAESAADLRARYNLRTPDALHVQRHTCGMSSTPSRSGKPPYDWSRN
jgi:predicted nucleic acid-binding protein